MDGALVVVALCSTCNQQSRVSADTRERLSEGAKKTLAATRQLYPLSVYAITTPSDEPELGFSQLPGASSW